jgi:hypothetical protein
MAVQALIMSDAQAATLGFPFPSGDVQVIDRQGLVWRWVDDKSGLSGLSGFWQSFIGPGGSIGGKVAAGAIGGPVGAAVGFGIGVISSIIGFFFSSHAKKVQREDEISGAWAAQGPAAIDAVMQAWKSGQVSGSDAVSGLQQIEQQFVQMTTPISKYNGDFGKFPDPEGPRPPNNCNWACGTYWDLHQQIKGLISQIQSSSNSAGAGFSLSDPITLGGLLLLGYFLIK